MKNVSDFNKIIALIFILAVIFLSAFFHLPVQIIDALTLKALPDFDIHLSFWRMLFEPFIGIPLYFNRSTYPIEEIQFTLIWALIFFIVFSVVKVLKIKNKQKRKKLTIARVVGLPIIGGLLFTFFVILVFLSRFFPANTIVNNAEDTILVTTHSHSVFSHDGLISQVNLWKWHKENNFDAFFITDHANHKKTFEFVEKQKSGAFAIEPLVMTGEEYSASNHLSLLGLKNKFATKGMSDETVVEAVHANGGVVIVNHWFDDENKSLEYYRDLGVDGFEIENSALERKYDRKLYHKIKGFCENNDLIMNGGLDYHGYGNVCSIWNAMEIKGWHKMNPVDKENAILNVIKSRDQSKLKVLLYDDRPYYTPDHLFWRPIITLINYFRTLGVSQILSWVFWVFFILLIKSSISEKKNLRKFLSFDRVISIFGLASAIFMLAFGATYYFKAKALVGTENDIFIEYSTILFYVGSVFLVYSSIVVYSRIFKKLKSK